MKFKTFDKLDEFYMDKIAYAYFIHILYPCTLILPAKFKEVF